MANPTRDGIPPPVGFGKRYRIVFGLALLASLLLLFTFLAAGHPLWESGLRLLAFTAIFAAVFHMAYLSRVSKRTTGLIVASGTLVLLSHALATYQELPSTQTLEFMESIRSELRLVESLMLQIGLLSMLIGLCFALYDTSVARMELKENEERYRQLAENVEDMVYSTDIEGKFASSNEAVERLLGYSREDLFGDNFSRIVPPEHVETAREMLRSKTRENQSTMYELEVFRKDGSRVWVEVNSRLVFKDGKPYRVHGVARDITKRKEAERVARETQESYQLLFQGSRDAIAFYGLGPVPLLFNDAYADMLGYTSEEFLSLQPIEILHPDDREWVAENNRRRMEGLPVERTYEVRVLHKDGRVLHVEGTFDPVLNHGETVGVQAILRDVTEKKAKDRAIRAVVEATSTASGEDFFRLLARNLAMVLDVRYVLVGKVLGKSAEEIRTLAFWANDDFASNYEYSLRGTPCERTSLSPDRVCFYEEGVQEAFPEDEILVEKNIESYLGVRLENSSGDFIGTLAVLDTKPIRREEFVRSIITLFALRAGAEIERLHSDEERGLLEDQLRQSQKMEALGQLAGGVAHDFNNLLQAIGGYTDLAIGDLDSREDPKQNLMEVARATDRASGLVRQLLTFSRRETLDPRRLNLDDTIANSMKMIRLVIGEHMELKVVSEGKQPVIYADRGQMEQVLVNLCVNARDAMPEGGGIVIRTGEKRVDADFVANAPWAKEGDYVSLSISDTGSGMTEDIRKRVFEPFFTTKEMGKGTGLGLATVYAIVKRHGGFIDVHSEPGRGTEFTLLFPFAADDQADTPQDLEKTNHDLSGSARILLAEDEELVQKLAVQILEKAGYQVSVARDGVEAVEVFEANPGGFDMAILDVVMPRKGGRAVHDAIKEAVPEFPVLFSSGYSFNQLDTGSLPNDGYELLQKPYTPDVLLAKVKEILESAKSPT